MLRNRHGKPYFTEAEFVDLNTLKRLQAKGLKAWNLFDPGLLFSVDNLRHYLGKPFIINNYSYGGDRKWSGYRSMYCLEGAVDSQHRLGRAVDFVPVGITADEVREIILKDPWNPKWKYITCLEMTRKGKSIPWVHMDTRNWDKINNGILQLNL